MHEIDNLSVVFSEKHNSQNKFSTHIFQGFHKRDPILQSLHQNKRKVVRKCSSHNTHVLLLILFCTLSFIYFALKEGLTSWNSCIVKYFRLFILFLSFVFTYHVLINNRCILSLFKCSEIVLTFRSPLHCFSEFSIMIVIYKQMI